MSAVLTLPAAVRLPRTVAARRALVAGLFLVAFVALGFAFGPGAHADGRTGTQALTGASSPATAPAEASTGDGVTDRAAQADRLSGSGAAFHRQGKAAGAKLTQDTDTASAAVVRAVRPAAERTARVTDPITRQATDAVREIGTTVGATLPVRLPSGEHAGRPGDGAAPAHGGASNGGQPAGPAVGPADAASATLHPAHCTDGPRTAVQHPRPALHQQRDQGHHGLPGQFPQGPVAPAPHSAGDGHGPRGGDLHAAAPADPTRFRLLPGGVRTADGAPTRRRAEDILEFPG
ncbi:hypothetical protein [Streptomyces sp. NPDC053427]|uniref:hypothetical protein n=1 Tax=Streptomyces sp. NPDC053427 TaxID=3365701 RepID=UPI0037D76C6E